MYRDILLLHLSQAERHVAQGDVHLAKQEDLIAELGRNGTDTELARAVLVTFIKLQSLHLQTRSRILNTLADMDPD